MPFEIQTQVNTPNLFKTDLVGTLEQAARDGLPDDFTQAQLDDAMAQLIMGELRSPKTLKTVRRRLVGLWSLIAPLAEREPEVFDEIILEYLDRQQTLSE